MDDVAKIADAVLYEGYMLWPYRRSALKNRQRWTFGGIFPREHSAEHEDDRWRIVTECLVEGAPGATVSVAVRFLHIVRRQVMKAGADDRLEPVDELAAGGETYLSWEEATEREITLEGLRLGELDAEQPIAIEQGSVEELLHHSDGSAAGAIRRSWEGLRGAVTASSEQLGEDLFRLSVRVANTTPWPGGPRELALERTFCSTHAVLRADGAQLVSATDPPQSLAEQAGACRNEGVWPVLVGGPGDRHTVLASPIILEDYPRIAPESPGDLFDGGEIDQLLTLQILSLTEDEKAEMRRTDPRTAEILDRTENLSEAEIMRLHGTVREFSHVRGGP